MLVGKTTPYYKDPELCFIDNIGSGGLKQVSGDIFVYELPAKCPVVKKTTILSHRNLRIMVR